VIAYMAARRNSNLWAAYAWIVFPLLPTLNLAWMNEDDFIHDRYMYMGMIGVAVIAASCYIWISEKLPSFRLQPLAACLVLVLALTSAVQSQYWANDVSLFARSVSRAPENEWAQLNYGSALSGRGKFAQAAPHFVRSYELKPGWRAADFAGFAYQQTGDLAQAEQWFNTALKFNPSLAAAWFGLGQIKLAQHQANAAISYLKKAVELDPNADGFHYELGRAFEKTSQNSAALDEYKIEVQLHPYQTGAAKAIARLEHVSNPD
jgi:protein O-mannosyl-transferase